ncbi:MAG: DUF1365 domain-containing protein [Planctomycetota bacterium]
MKSAIYRGRVEHARHAPMSHRFGYRLYMLYIDLAELDDLFDKRWLWSRERANFASFYRADYLGDPKQPLREAVLDEVERALGRRPTGAVRMLTQPRCFGLSFNPVSFYYCFDEADQVEAVLAEITNTPWNERHRYVVGRDDKKVLASRFGKDFHISPFMPMNQEHDWLFAPPGEELTVRMHNLERGDRVFDANLQMERLPWTGKELAKTLVLHPFISLKVLFGIYFQALRLKLKGAPYFAHPAQAVKEPS